MRSGFLPLLAIAVMGCVNPLDEQQQSANPGQPVGTFAVSAIESADTCGAGALGSPASYSFNVTMSVDGSTIYWNTGNGSVVPGSLAADGVTFTFETSATTDMRTAVDTSTSSSSTTGGVPLPPCSIERVDTGTGTLAGDSTGVASFAGTLSYAFTPTAGSSCLDLVESVAPTFAALPCTMSYGMNGARQ